MENDLKIGMSFSGGGYRAATFDLGTLSFLNSIRLEDGDGRCTLLDYVVALSSVSGGTIPAMSYMLARARGEDVDVMVKKLFRWLCEEDLMTHALKRLGEEKANPEVSSIKIMAEIYDSCLFGGATMGDIIDHFDRIPVKDYTALASDFDNSLPFRFRLTEGRMSNGQRLTYGVFGNQKHSISRSVVRHITPGEALACSSCFPSGFEPMMYPGDFKVSQRPDVAQNIKGSFGIMDGGVVDNQGIDPILLAEERLYKYRADKTRTDKALDMIIVSDVSSPYMQGYKPSGQALPHWAGKLTIGRLRNYGLIVEAAVLLFFILSIVLGNGFLTGVAAVLLLLATIANLAGAKMKKMLFRFIEGTFVGDRAAFISHLKFATFESMFMNRAKSLLMMSSEVFLKRLRQMNYNSLHGDEAWLNRIVSVAIYELCPAERWESMFKNGTLPAGLAPSDAMQQNSKRAASMGTTLWFTPEEKAAGMPADLLAAGQYTTCYNLLSYIEKIGKNPVNLTSGHNLLIACKPQLLDAWKRFLQDPHCMVP